MESNFKGVAQNLRPSKPLFPPSRLCVHPAFVRSFVRSFFFTVISGEKRSTNFYDPLTCFLDHGIFGLDTLTVSISGLNVLLSSCRKGHGIVLSIKLFSEKF